MSVLCLGEALVTVNRPADQPPPAWGRCWVSTAGAEYNIAIGLARLGHAVRWVSAVGDDELGDHIVAAARGEGVQVEVERRLLRTALLVKVARADAEPVVHYYREGSAFALQPPAVDLAGASHLVISGVIPALSPACRELAQDAVLRARAGGVAVCVDLNMRRKLWSEAEAAPELSWLAARADLVLAAEDEAALVVGAADPAEQARRLCAHGARRAVVKATDGAYADGDRGRAFAPRLRGVVVRDAIGAGDAFDAGYLSGDLDGLDTIAALVRGHACAVAVCRTMGDWEGLPHRRELDIGSVYR